MTAELKAAFGQFFDCTDLGFLDELLAQPGRGTIPWQYVTPWEIRYLVEIDAQGCTLEVYAINRFTNDQHIKIDSAGVVSHFASPIGYYSYDPALEGDREAQQQAMYTYNRAIYAELRAKGLIDS